MDNVRVHQLESCCLPSCFSFLGLSPWKDAKPGHDFVRTEGRHLPLKGHVCPVAIPACLRFLKTCEKPAQLRGIEPEAEPEAEPRVPKNVELCDLSEACHEASMQRWLVAQRMVVVTKWLLPVAARCAVDLMRSGGPKHAVANARRMKESLEALGPAFIKLGQALACREDILSDGVVAELRALCDQVGAFPYEQAKLVVEEELGHRMLVLPKEPVAAASLGQVYRVQVDGKEYALKVQRPGLAKALAVDVVILKGIARVLRRLRALCCATRMDPEQVVENWAKTLWQELDYRKEAESQEHCRKNICSQVKGLIIPSVLWKLSTVRVLATEWIDGIKLTEDPCSVTAKQIQIGVETYASMILDHGVVHADPHAGNLLLTKQDGSMCLLDFGMVIQIPEEHRKAWASCIVHLVRGNYPQVLENLVKIGFFPRDCAREVILPVMSKIWKELVLCGSSTQKRKTAVRACYSEILTLVRKFNFDLPDYYVALVRALLSLEGMALSADCDFDIFQAAFPVALRTLSSTAAKHSPIVSKALLFAANTKRRDLLVVATGAVIAIAAYNSRYMPSV